MHVHITSMYYLKVTINDTFVVIHSSLTMCSQASFFSLCQGVYCLNLDPKSNNSLDEQKTHWMNSFSNRYAIKIFLSLYKRTSKSIWLK